MDPDKYSPGRHQQEYGSIVEGKLLSGIAGHSICLDYFGSPSPQEAELGLSQHGEAPSSRWTIDHQSANDSAARLRLKVRLPAAGLRFSREITVRRGESVAYFHETVRNERKVDHFFHWTQHVTLGPPFLCRGSATVAVSGSKALTSPDEYDEGKTLLAPGTAFRWPRGPQSPKGTVDLSRPFSRKGSGYVAAVLLEPAREMGFIAVLNTQERVLFGYCFSQVDSPWVTVWEENRAIEAVPWKGTCQALGLEFGTTPMPVGRRENFLNGGPLFGTPTMTFIPARATKSVRYIAFLANVPSDFARLRDIRIGNGELLFFSAGSKLPLRMAASRIVAWLAATPHEPMMSRASSRTIVRGCSRRSAVDRIGR